MIRSLAAILICAVVAGCKTADPLDIRPQVSVSGPVFSETRFDCGTKPVPPDPRAVGSKAGSAAAHYENRLMVWGQHCSNNLNSVRQELKASGQVVNAAGAHQ